MFADDADLHERPRLASHLLLPFAWRQLSALLDKFRCRCTLLLATEKVCGVKDTNRRFNLPELYRVSAVGVLS